MKFRTYASAAALAVAGVALAGTADAQTRDQISIVGSSTVFPYTQAVAEVFANSTDFPSPVVESTGSGGGMQIFCQGVGVDNPDITGASRAMTQSEYDLCQENGVESITEVQIGSDGLSLAISVDGPDFDLTKAEIFQALAAQVEVDGEIVDNPYTNWSEINSDLPDMDIEVFGPPPTSGTRDAFVELAMEEGCMEFPAIAALEGDEQEDVCARMRTDGPFVEAGENDNLIVQRLQEDSATVGIFGYSFLYENQDALKAVTVGGVSPNPDTIADGSYGISRPLFFYIKNAHREAIPGMEEFIAEYLSEEAFGNGGYLEERGLVPLPEARREEVREAAMNGTHMDRY
ncbi:substrate-binding domain-containing protein [Fodinicurvata sp. EGI_FJ10296]|uniref:substrate-binding domain-containing protein n=1 Tax=Fodinicurvata sp. EGI_FJ10296 TaxID=3231908 RepID=UPI0034515973